MTEKHNNSGYGRPGRPSNAIRFSQGVPPQVAAMFPTTHKEDAPIIWEVWTAEDAMKFHRKRQKGRVRRFFASATLDKRVSLEQARDKYGPKGHNVFTILDITFVGDLRRDYSAEQPTAWSIKTPLPMPYNGPVLSREQAIDTTPAKPYLFKVTHKKAGIRPGQPRKNMIRPAPIVESFAHNTLVRKDVRLAFEAANPDRKVTAAYFVGKRP